MRGVECVVTYKHQNKLSLFAGMAYLMFIKNIFKKVHLSYYWGLLTPDIGKYFMQFYWERFVL